MDDNNNTLHNLIKLIAKRPAAFVGKGRLDYIDNFISGLYMYRSQFTDNKMLWNFNDNMQKWLFLKESASIAGRASINGWSLIKRCYGNDYEACKKFNDYVAEVPFDECESPFRYNKVISAKTYGISNRLNKFYEEYENGDSNTNLVDNEYLNEELLKQLYISPNKSYESIIPYVQKMIPEAYDDLWIYIKYERYFLQVRFIYFSKDKGWVESTSLVDQEDYYLRLIFLHGYAEFIKPDRKLSQIVSIHYINKNLTEIQITKVEDVWFKIFNQSADISMCNKIALAKSYLDWKNSIIEREINMELTYSKLNVDDINLEKFMDFNRFQEVNQCWRKIDSEWVLKDIQFVDDWSNDDKEVLVRCLRNTVNTDGAVLGAFDIDKLVGFASIESDFFGSNNEYIQLSSLHISNEYRGNGIGKKLFSLIANEAKKKGAKKLYISSHSSKETQAFYKNVGCVWATEVNDLLLQKEPFDCQLEFCII